MSYAHANDLSSFFIFVQLFWKIIFTKKLIARLTEHDDVMAPLLRRAPHLGLALGPAPANQGKVSPTFPAALFFMHARFASKIEKPQKGIKWADATKWTQATERTSSEHNIQKKKKLANMLYQARKNCSKQPTFWKWVIIKRKIKILSEGVTMTNFISKSSEFIELLICEKIAGVIFV